MKIILRNLNPKCRWINHKLALRTFSNSYINEGTLYIHWPFCLKRCSYCNFNKYIPRGGQEEESRMIKCMVKEINYLFSISHIKTVNSIFFGGGTPSLCSPDSVSTIIETVKGLGLIKNAEITLEANPTTVEGERLKSYKEAGVNRISLGVQVMFTHK